MSTPSVTRSGGDLPSPGSRRQCTDCLSYGIVTWTKSKNAPRCHTHAALRRSWSQARWRAENEGRTFPEYEVRILGARHLLLTPKQFDEIEHLIDAIATAAHDIGSRRENTTLEVFADLAASSRRLRELLKSFRDVANVRSVGE